MRKIIQEEVQNYYWRGAARKTMKIAAADEEDDEDCGYRVRRGRLQRQGATRNTAGYGNRVWRGILQRG
ncbi:hypothetical protein ACOSP7_007422 [Xanthoceras sorbifolium]